MKTTTAMRLLLLGTLVACACPSKPSTTGPGSGVVMGSGSGRAVPDSKVTSCDAARPKVEQLYRAEGEQKEPKRVEAFVADNTAMVLADCARNAAKVVPCLAAAQTVAEVEANCVTPLDDEGTEGDASKIAPRARK